MQRMHQAEKLRIFILNQKKKKVQGEEKKEDTLVTKLKELLSKDLPKLTEKDLQRWKKIFKQELHRSLICRVDGDVDDDVDDDVKAPSDDVREMVSVVAGKPDFVFMRYAKRRLT